MCGLVLMIMRDNRVKEDVRRALFSELLYASALRGDDATGIFATSWDSSSEAAYKRAIPAHDFINLPTFNKIMLNIDKFNVLMGHTRKATYLSAHEDSGAHPFTKGPITLVHNGHLSNPQSLPRTPDPLLDADQTMVDSDLLARAFADAGYEETLLAANGAFALTWFDRRDGALRITRNGGRPFFFGEVAELDIIVGGSELPMLEWVLDRNGLHFKKDKKWELAPPYYAKKKGQYGYVMDFTKGSFPNFNKTEVMLERPRPIISREVGYGNTPLALPQERKALYGTPTELSGPTTDTGADSATKIDDINRKKKIMAARLHALGLHTGMEVQFGIDRMIPYANSAKRFAAGMTNTLLAGAAFGLAQVTSKDGNGKEVKMYYPAVVHSRVLNNLDTTFIYNALVNGVTYDERQEEHVLVLVNSEATKEKINKGNFKTQADMMEHLRLRAVDITALLKRAMNNHTFNDLELEPEEPSAKKAHAPTGGQLH